MRLAASPADTRSSEPNPLADLRVVPSPTGLGFPTAEAVTLGAALLGGHNADLGPGLRARPGDLGPRYRLVVSPGSLALRVLQKPPGWEDPDDPRSAAVRHGWDLVHGDVAGWARDSLDLDLPEHTCVEVLPPIRYSRWWSDRSRSRMVRALSTVDWAPVFSAAGCRPAMVTLTYPGDWLAVAPDAATAKGHLARFGRALKRLFDVNGLDPVGAVWKLEFQRRGAPHFHLYAAVPVGQVTWKVGRGRGAVETTGSFQRWCSDTWAHIVGAEGDERERHRLAGTGVDFGEGARMSDPKRLAVYFVRHNAKGSRSKAYQHHVPEEWPDAGRWWGTWGLSRLTAEVEVDRQELVDARRFLRRWIESQYVKGAPRKSPRQAPRGITASGRQRRRWVNRRYRLPALHGSLGGFVVANDGPALAAVLGRYLDHERGARSG